MPAPAVYWMLSGPTVLWAVDRKGRKGEKRDRKVMLASYPILTNQGASPELAEPEVDERRALYSR